MPHRLDRLFHAQCVAVVGASARNRYTVSLVDNARAHGFRGELLAVNPNYEQVLDLPCYPRLEALPRVPDLVVLATPAPTVPGLLRAAGALGCGAAIVFAAGFAEAEGRELQAEVRSAAAAHDLPVVGPNCLGIAGFADGFLPGWALQVRARRRPGPVGAVLQSGNLANHLIGNHRGLELSYVVSCGNQAVLDVSDYLEWLTQDPATAVIGLVVEGVRDGLRLLAAARRARSAGKPVVVLKVGRSERGTELARSHTASLTGDDRVWQALFRRAGALAVDDFDEFLETCKLVAACGPEGGTPALGAAFMASSGGECGLAADLAAAAGLPLPRLAPATVARLREVLPSYANPQNPLDYTATGWGNPPIYEPAMQALIDDPSVGLVASILDPPPGTGSSQLERWDAMGEVGARIRRATPKPIVIVSSAADFPAALREPLEDAGLVVLQGLGTGVRAMAHLARLSREALPVHPACQTADDPELAGLLAADDLTEPEAKGVLRRIGLAVPRAAVVADPAQAVAAARALGYPVVLKAVGVPHKSSHGGVRVGVADDGEVRAGFAAVQAGPRRAGFAVPAVLIEEQVAGAEFFLGARAGNPPTVTFGLGGVDAEALDDVAVEVAPLGEREAHAMIGRLRSARLLGGFRGRPPRDVEAIADALVRLSHFICAWAPHVAEVDINPLLVREAGRGCVAADCLIVRGGDPRGRGPAAPDPDRPRQQGPQPAG